MMPATAAIAADAETTGASPGSDLDRFLKLQRLKLEDLESNRAGRVSKRQLEIVTHHRNFVTMWLLIAWGVAVLIGVGYGVSHYMQKKSFMMFIVPGIMLAMGAIAYGVYAALWKFPSDFADHKVVLVNGRAEAISYLPTRTEYKVTVNGVTYKGFGDISPDYNGLTLNFYVLPDDKLVMAVEPIEAK